MSHTVIAYRTSFPDAPFIPSAPSPWPQLQPTTSPETVLLLQQLQSDVSALRQSHETMKKAVEAFLDKMAPLAGGYADVKSGRFTTVPPKVYRDPKWKPSKSRARKRANKAKERK